MSSFYSEEELSAAKILINEICVKKLQDCEITRTIARKGENKRKADAVDLLKFFIFLDEQKYSGSVFIALNLRSPLIEKKSVDLCLMLESIMEMKKAN